MADADGTLKKRRLAGKYPVPIFVRATEEEAAAIRRNATRAGRACTRFLAELGARDDAPGLLPAKPPEREIAALEELTFQLRKVGVNLNQLAYRENSADAGGAAEPPTDAELMDAARAIQATVALIQAQLR